MPRSRLLAVLLGPIAFVLLINTPAYATSFTIHTTLLGLNEVPPNASPATGSADITVLGDVLTVDESWSGLIGGNPAAAHIHCCAPAGTNVGVAVGFPSFPAATSGTYLHVFNMLDPTIYTSAFLSGLGGGTAAGAEAALINGMLAGNAYVNIHNSVYPGGEIRGQLGPVPEPATMFLLGSGLIGAGIRRYRRTR